MKKENSTKKNNSSSRGVLIIIMSSISLVLEPSGKWNLVLSPKEYRNSFAAKLVRGQGSRSQKIQLE